MSSQFITLKKNDSRFADYLMGKIDGNYMAIPIKTYNLGTEEESVTFELIKTENITRPSFFIFLSSLVKLNKFVLILLPLLFVLAKALGAGQAFDAESLVYAAVAMIFLFAGLNMRNDINDHISGFDRVNVDISTKPLKAGWLTAQKASLISNVLIFFSFLFALPVMIVHAEVLRVMAVVMILFLVGKFARANSYKQQHLGEFILFVLMGPALVCGYQLSMDLEIDKQILAFGMVWGLLVLYVVQINNFSHIMTSTQAGIHNTMTRLGFDLSQKFIILYWSLFVVILSLYQALFVNLNFAVISALSLLCISIPFFIGILNIKSPMGSGLSRVYRYGYLLFLSVVFIFSGESLYLLWKIQS